MVDDRDVTVLDYAGEPAVSVTKHVVHGARRLSVADAMASCRLRAAALSSPKTCCQEQDGFRRHFLRLNIAHLSWLDHVVSPPRKKWSNPWGNRSWRSRIDKFANRGQVELRKELLQLRSGDEIIRGDTA